MCLQQFSHYSLITILLGCFQWSFYQLYCLTEAVEQKKRSYSCPHAKKTTQKHTYDS